jgi:nicotinate phosphoribosyltransferase
MVFVSGGLDERGIAELLAAGAPIGGFGVGSRMGVAADVGFLDMAYKLVELDGRPVLKLSPGKATLPGPKQVWRLPAYDVLAPGGADGDGEPLLRDVMRAGEPTWQEPLVDSRKRACRERESLPESLRALDAPSSEVRVHPALEALRDEAVRAASII